MSTWRIWYSRQPAFNWVVAREEGSDMLAEVHKVKHVRLQVASRTEEEPERGGKFPPSFCMLVDGEVSVKGDVLTVHCGKEDSCV